jgi:hypothetical protein
MSAGVLGDRRLEEHSSTRPTNQNLWACRQLTTGRAYHVGQGTVHRRGR